MMKERIKRSHLGIEIREAKVSISIYCRKSGIFSDVRIVSLLFTVCHSISDCQRERETNSISERKASFYNTRTAIINHIKKTIKTGTLDRFDQLEKKRKENDEIHLPLGLKFLSFLIN